MTTLIPPRVRPVTGLVAAIALSALGLNLHAADNLLANGNFESDLNGWELFIGPEFREVGANATAEAKLDSGSNGSAAAVLTTDIPIRYGLTATRKDLIAVDAGARYKISGKVKVAEDAELRAARAAIYIRLALMESPTKPTQDPKGNIHVGLNGQVVRTPDWTQLISSEVTNDWQTIEAEVEIPDGQSFVAVGLFSDHVKGTVYWDDIVLEKIQ
jgi:hypothetical protein